MFVMGSLRPDGTWSGLVAVLPRLAEPEISLDVWLGTSGEGHAIHFTRKV